MKALGRILIILVAFAVVMGITYGTVNASGSSSTSTPQFESGERPASPSGQFEGRPEGQEGGGGLMFGLIKNIGIIAIVVTLIALPKSVVQKKKRTTAVPTE